MIRFVLLFLCMSPLFANTTEEKNIYRNNLKNREFSKEHPQNFCPEEKTIAERQGSSEDQNFEGNATKEKTDSSGCFGIYTEIVDEASLPLLSSDLKGRQIGKIALPNGMQILLISDPNADKSAAVVSVGSGGWSDPPEYPGMAHFCEHMLFMGTEKYPDTHDFFSQVSNFDGHTNAFTAADKTVYMFSCHTPGFLSLLDRFAHFFIDPLFNPSNIAREMHAVDQEFSLHIENDAWREFMVFKETSNPNHPNHLFSTGNSKTLAQIPQRALKEWHKAHYGANRMRAALYSSLPLETMKQEAAQAFTSVPTITDPKNKPQEKIFCQQQQGHITFIEPIRRCQELSLSWELPSHLVFDETRSADFVAYLLQQGHPHSLRQKLKREKLVDDLHVGLNRRLSDTTALFTIQADLSDEGFKNKEKVIESIFQAIQGLKSSPISQELFQEKNRLSQLGYQYQSRIDAFQYIESIGRFLSSEDLETYPRKTLLGTQYNLEKVQDTLEALTPKQCYFSLLAPQTLTQVSYDKKEQWLSVPYTIQEIPSDLLNQWSVVQPNPEIQLASLNPFTPKDLTLIADPGLGDHPICIAESNFGQAYYVRLSEYQNPEAAVHLHIFSPEIGETPKSAVLSSLYIDHLTDHLHPVILAAMNANLKANFTIEKNHLHIELTGFSEKLPLLLQKIVQAMPASPPTREEFGMYLARHEKDYANGGKNLPVKQALELLSSLINPSRFTKKELLSALQKMSFEDFSLFHKKLFEKTYFQALFAGNLSMKDAESAWLDTLNTLGKSPYPQGDLPLGKALQLPDHEGPFFIPKTTQSQGNATVLLLDEGNFSFEKKASQKILSANLGEAFFDTLRTKQKTGYIAQSFDLECEKHLYQAFLVQSNSHQPDDLLHRFELFLEEYRQDFSVHMPESRFEMLKQSIAESWKTESRNIAEKADLLDSLAFEEQGDFAFVQKKIKALEDLSYDTFKQFSEEWLSRQNKKRLAVLYTGQTPSPFVYLPMTEKDLPETATYEPRSSSTF